MWVNEGMITNKRSDEVSTVELKQLLVEIKEHRRDICIRFRILGQMWQQNFVKVITVTDERVMVNDERLNRLMSLELRNIMQFEVDDRFQVYSPHYHYTVTSSEW